jgi:F-type H+-transporting ATPase subunit epsilon
VTLQVELVSPERILYSGQADMVIARTVGGGDIAFLTGHAPFVGALDVATLTIRSSGEGDKVVAVHGGFVEVSSSSSGSGSGSSGAGDGAGSGGAVPETTVTILSDVAELADQIDVDRARQAQQQAEERLRSEDDAEAQAALQRAHVRLQVAGAEAP